MALREDWNPNFGYSKPVYLFGIQRLKGSEYGPISDSKGLFRETKNYLSTAKPEETVPYPVIDCVLFNPGIVNERLGNSKNYQDDAIRNVMIKDPNLVLALDNIHFVLNDNRLIRLFYEALSQLEPTVGRDEDIIDYRGKLNWANSVYNDANLAVNNQIITVSEKIFRSEVKKMVILGFDEMTSAKLILTRYASDNEITNIISLNAFLTQLKAPIEQVICVYEKLFDNASPLFIGGYFCRDRFPTCALAILEIMTNMHMDQIMKVLENALTFATNNNMAMPIQDILNLPDRYCRISYDMNELLKYNK